MSEAGQRSDVQLCQRARVLSTRLCQQASRQYDCTARHSNVTLSDHIVIRHVTRPLRICILSWKSEPRPRLSFTSGPYPLPIPSLSPPYPLPIPSLSPPSVFPSLPLPLFLPPSPSPSQAGE
eukprot:1284160-Rhodomonas_salina.4